MPLDSPRPYSASEINRLAPAAERKRLLICVAPKAEGNGDDLHIWALLDTGENWWKFVHHETSGGFPPPNFLTVTSTAPGEVSTSAQGLVLVTLRNGQIFTPSADALWAGPLSDFLDTARRRFYDEVVAALGSKKFDSEGHDDDYPQRFYTFFLERLLFYTRQKGHGGSILLVPNYLSREDTRLTDRLHIKYPCIYNSAWGLLKKSLVNHRRYYDLYFPLMEKNIVKKKEFSELNMLSYEKEELEAALGDVAQAIASLTAVDGALVINDQCDVLGFGAEVTAASPTLVNVRVPSNSKTPHELPITSFGTRHRSAFRFCSSLEECAAFVVSQDGGVKAVKRVGSHVILWPDINAGSMGV
jgi:hypothetical protein